jgi:hypothetical protein
MIRIGVERNHTVPLLYVYGYKLSIVILKTLKLKYEKKRTTHESCNSLFLADRWRGPYGLRRGTTIANYREHPHDFR